MPTRLSFFEVSTGNSLLRRYQSYIMKYYMGIPQSKNCLNFIALDEPPDVQIKWGSSKL